jgi:hypothetical protein
MQSGGVGTDDENESSRMFVKHDASEQAASITMAQVMVLHYLPTRLSFAVIADKLGTSRSAAKERRRVSARHTKHVSRQISDDGAPSRR